jgi:hypothetical protein
MFRYFVGSSVAVPDPYDPYVFGPPISQKYIPGSDHLAKIVRKILIPTVKVTSL